MCRLHGDVRAFDGRGGPGFAEEAFPEGEMRDAGWIHALYNSAGTQHAASLHDSSVILLLTLHIPHLASTLLLQQHHLVRDHAVQCPVTDALRLDAAEIHS
jgi:hypothetical protein